MECLALIESLTCFQVLSDDVVEKIQLNNVSRTWIRLRDTSSGGHMWILDRSRHGNEKLFTKTFH